jgi:hypothetical protein
MALSDDRRIRTARSGERLRSRADRRRGRAASAPGRRKHAAEGSRHPPVQTFCNTSDRNEPTPAGRVREQNLLNCSHFARDTEPPRTPGRPGKSWCPRFESGSRHRKKPWRSALLWSCAEGAELGRATTRREYPIGYPMAGHARPGPDVGRQRHRLNEVANRSTPHLLGSQDMGLSPQVLNAHVSSSRFWAVCRAARTSLDGTPPPCQPKAASNHVRPRTAGGNPGEASPGGARNRQARRSASAPRSSVASPTPGGAGIRRRCGRCAASPQRRRSASTRPAPRPRLPAPGGGLWAAR